MQTHTTGERVDWEAIRAKATAFAKEWQEETREEAEAKTFWDEFFRVFGLRRKDLASFEEPVKRLDRKAYGFIDLFWRGVLIAEHKSAGKDLDKAKSQALDYVQDLISSGRKSEVPRYLIISDFARVALHDLEGNRSVRFNLEDLPKHVRLFGFLLGENQTVLEQRPLDIAAAELLGELHDALKASGYEGHPLERYLIRILFCLFAEDTEIFEPGAFTNLVQQSREDGSDLGPALGRLFEVLNTPEDKRQRSLNPALAGFRYINGGLFKEQLPLAEFDAQMRQVLINCAYINWDEISPAIFGSLFQAVMEPAERRRTGSHYTSEADILKVIKPLFLDELWERFRLMRNQRTLKEFHDELARLRFLDPACGCGNFLVVAYRELRKLELEVIKALQKFRGNQQVLDIQLLCRVNVDQMYGIENQEWPACIAEVSLWIMDHLMNQEASKECGRYFHRLPLVASPSIRHANALRLDWAEVIKPGECTHIMGNPPFIGGKWQDAEQKADLKFVADGCRNVGLLDYVCGWYFKAAQFIQGTGIKVGFVSTNSITQGEQVGVLWEEMLNRYQIKIHFAHRTFPWQSEARGKAHVHVVNIGFANFVPAMRRLFDYDAKGMLIGESRPANINPYLTDGPDILIKNRETPICEAPRLGTGNQPIDGGHYLFDDTEFTDFVTLEPAAMPFFRRWIGSEEFINNEVRWCLWLRDCPPQQLRRMPHVMGRVEKVKAFRLASPRPATRKLAETPTRFAFENPMTSDFLLIPEVSSETRAFIPMGFMSPDHAICSNLVKLLPGATRFHFGVLSSTMHMAWVRTICGRMKSDFRYSAKLVYNNFPWPRDVGDAQKKAVETAAQQVLTVRDGFTTKGSTLADLYDPLTMPPELVDAHRDLDRAVDKCYRAKAFANERERVEFLFCLHGQQVKFASHKIQHKTL